jgi:hypothetical protein
MKQCVSVWKQKTWSNDCLLKTPESTKEKNKKIESIKTSFAKTLFTDTFDLDLREAEGEDDEE